MHEDRRSIVDNRMISTNNDTHDGDDNDVVVDEKSIEQAMYDLFLQQLAEDFGINHGSNDSNDKDDDDDDDDDYDKDDDGEKINALKRLSILPARRLVLTPTKLVGNCVVEFILNNRLTIGNRR